MTRWMSRILALLRSEGWDERAPWKPKGPAAAC